MNCSQNVRFRGIVLNEEQYDPQGYPIASLLSASLPKHGWKVSEIENWRDCGWSIYCTRNTTEIQIALAGSNDEGWMLQVAPQRVPGIIGRLRGRAMSASPSEIYELSIQVHDALSKDATYSNFMWRWDGPPNENHSTAKPIEPEGS